MKTETLHNTTILKIGFGTAALGGSFLPNRSQDARYLAVMRSALELGYRHIDTAEMYALGHSEEIIGRAIREMGIPREDLFITSKVMPMNLRHKSVLRACERSLRRLGMDYIDLYLVHWPNPLIPLKDTFRALNQLVREGKIHHVGVSNFNLARLQEAQSLSETPIFANQVPYSIQTRTYAQNGVVAYCQRNDTPCVVTAYSPVEHGNVGVSQAIQSIAEAHHATPHQIALAWLVNQPRVIAIPMSFNPQHQRENLEAADIELSQAEMEQLNHLAP